MSHRGFKVASPIFRQAVLVQPVGTQLGQSTVGFTKSKSVPVRVTASRVTGPRFCPRRHIRRQRPLLVMWWSSPPAAGSTSLWILRQELTRTRSSNTMCSTGTNQRTVLTSLEALSPAPPDTSETSRRVIITFWPLRHGMRRGQVSPKWLRA